MKVVNLRQFKAKQDRAARREKGKKLPPDHLAPLIKIPSTAIKSSEDDDFDRMVDNMVKDSDALLRGSEWLLRAAERLRKDSRKINKFQSD
jgi:hypothetical protein